MPALCKRKNQRRFRRFVCLLLIVQTLPGCLYRDRKLKYFGGERQLNYYVDAATEISYPVADEPTPETITYSKTPRTLRDRAESDEIWDMTLAEGIHLAMLNNKIIRVNDFNTSTGIYPLGGTRILSAPDTVPSIWDPAIQESGPLFGNRGVEAALAAFDTTFATSMLWGRSELVQNNLFSGAGLPPGSTLNNETGAFTSSLTKNIASGGQFSLSHNWNYLGTNAPTTLFPSSYSGSVAANFVQPLWAGSGVEYTRIAGPIGQGFQGITGVSQGVSIARINGDISIADFESNVMNMVFDTEKAYWDLYNAYRQYDVSVANRSSALRTWREVKAKFDLGARGGGAADEAQARETYFQRRALEDAALNNVNKLEVALRRMCGLPVNDGRIIRPVDEPITANFIPDWYTSMADALSRHVLLRQQRWKIQSLDLQLTAARSLTNPQLNLVSSYSVNGFGDKLLSYHDNDGLTAEGFNSAYGSLTQGNQTSWTSGFQFSMPLGFRQAHAQVRNVELRLAKARQLLSVQEEEISYELARAFQDLALHRTNSETNFNRRRAAERQVQAFEAEYETGTKTLDLLLRAQSALAEAETAYYNSLIEYSKTIAFINYRKGTILEINNIHLAEGQWSPDAYKEALRRAWARSYAVDNNAVHQEPEPFASPDVIGGTDFAGAEAANQIHGGAPLPPVDPGVPGLPPALPGVDVPQMTDEELPASQP